MIKAECGSKFYPWSCKQLVRMDEEPQKFKTKKIKKKGSELTKKLKKVFRGLKDE